MERLIRTIVMAHYSLPASFRLVPLTDKGGQLVVALRFRTEKTCYDRSGSVVRPENVQENHDETIGPTVTVATSNMEVG